MAAAVGAVLATALVSGCPKAAHAGAPLFAVELSYRGDHTRVVVGLPRPLDFAAAVDAAGGRIDVDFDGLTAVPDGSVGVGVGVVRTYHAESESGRVRLILDLARPAIVTAVRALPTEPGRPARAVIDLVATTSMAMRSASGVAWRLPGAPQAASPAEMPRSNGPESIAALIDSPAAHVLVPPKPAPQPAEISPTAPRARPAATPVAAIIPPDAPKLAPSAPPAGGRRIIVIDAGHGGIDPGAESVAGYHEKEVTLATARVLRRVLEQTGRYRVVLTRDSDTYLKLHERVARARAAHGSLFVSLHADSVADSSSTAHGASIYTLSETASDAETERLAQRENRADAIGGVDLGDKSDDVAGILVDLTVRETVNEGNRLAGMIADGLRQQGVGLLSTDPHRSAGFAVLKSPDIPSVLVEMGYLSDKADARGLADPRHQAQIAKAIALGVDRYFAWATGRS